MTFGFRFNMLVLIMFSTASAQLHQFAGEWENVDANTSGVTRLKISVDGEYVAVQAWGKCHPQDCDWGEVEATAYASNVSSNLADSAQALSAVFQPSFGQVLMLIHPVADRLRAEVLTRFTDRSGRTNYTAVYTFIRRVPLTVITIPQFIDWASGSDSTGYLKAKEEIVKARQDSTVLPPLFEEFERSRNANDVGRSLVILGLIGELKNPRATGRLAAIIDEPLPQPEEVHHRLLNIRDVAEMIKVKAVQGLAYLQTSVSDSLTLAVITRHPSTAVRSAAIDAYLYNHGDSAAVKERLKPVLHKEDLLFLDRVRRTSTISREAFNTGLERFYQLNPEALPPAQATAQEFWKILWVLLAILMILVLVLLGLFIIYKRRKIQKMKKL